MRAAPALACLLLASCERAGADLENAERQPVTVIDALRDSSQPMTYVIQAGETVQSVWRVGEHRYYEFRWPSGKVMRFQGNDLNRIAKECPKHCILRLTNAGVKVVRTDLFGQRKE